LCLPINLIEDNTVLKQRYIQLRALMLFQNDKVIAMDYWMLNILNRGPARMLYRSAMKLYCTCVTRWVFLSLRVFVEK
jgi:hypothetical protein